MPKEGKLPLEFRYSLGIAGEKFWETWKEKKKLLASYCNSCKEAFLPPQIFCDKCGEEITLYKEYPPEGEVYSWTEVFYDHEGKKLSSSVFIAWVKIPGVRGGIFSIIPKEKACKGEKVFISLPEEVEW